MKLLVKDGYARFFCPGCQYSHLIPVEGPRAWRWNGNVNSPTFAPSIKVFGGVCDPHLTGKPTTVPTCHSWVTDGEIRFLADSGHALAGQTVPLPEIETSD